MSIVDAVEELTAAPDEDLALLDEEATTATEPVEITSNITTVSLVDGSITSEKKNKTTVKKKGRPVVHLFSGRINLLREEVNAALENGDAFIEQMQTEHRLDEKRRSELIAAGLLDLNVDQFFYTFQGPIAMVLEEMQRVQDKYQSAVDAGTCSIRYDFHKKKIVTNEKHPLYVAPKTEKRGQDIVTVQSEAFPDVVYGYASVTLNK